MAPIRTAASWRTAVRALSGPDPAASGATGARVRIPLRAGRDAQVFRGMPPSGGAPSPCLRLPPQQQGGVVEVPGGHGEGHHPGEAVRALRPDPVEAAVLQAVHADSTAGCWRRISANSPSRSRSRPALPSLPFFGSALQPGSPSRRTRFAGL